MRIKIRKPKALTTGNLMLGSILGALTGYYIWKVPLEYYQKDQQTRQMQILEEEKIKKL